jgi:transcriptional regulator with XRE-family HTH domain
MVKKLVQARKDRGLSQRQLASEAGVHLNTVWKTETQQSHPSYEVAAKLSRALGLEPTEIAEFAPVVQAAKGQDEEGWPIVVRQSSERSRDMEFVEREGLESIVEVEAANATQVSPDEQDIRSNPELARIGLIHAMRAIMRYLGKEETLRAFRAVFGEKES